MIKAIGKLAILSILAFTFSCNSGDDVANNDAEIDYTDKNLNAESKERLESLKITKTEKDGIVKVDVTDLYSQMKDVNDKDKYLKFSLERGTYVDDDNWDIAFYNRSIVINGGELVAAAPYSTPEPTRKGNVQLAIMGKMDYEEEIQADNLVAIAKETDGDYLNVTMVPENIDFRQDHRNEFAIDDSSKGMFEYNNSPLGHVVTVKKNRFLIIKTVNGHYAKLKLKSLYKDGGKTATIAQDMNEAITKYFGYYTFTYSYNKVKGDKKLN